MSARSLRKALKCGSGRSDGPVSAKSSALVGVCGGLPDDRPVGRGTAVALAEVALEPFKKFCPAVGADDEHVAPIVLVPFAAEIAERTERIQGARHDRLGYAENLGQTADRVRSWGQIDQHH